MSEPGQEQNKTEEATPFKLRRAREKGMVARGLDLGFLAGLAALAAFITIAGETLAQRLAQAMRLSIAGANVAGEPGQAMNAVAANYWPALQSIALLGGTIVLLVFLLEIIQLRGIVFSTHPLKPDFSRLNPAKGAKRIFSLRMLKEAIKNVLKLAAYSAVTFLVLWAAVESPNRVLSDATGLVEGLRGFGMRLLMLFILVALAFAALDQLLVRREYAKQMRMSRRELVRETREREGEPRLKQKRKQLHAEFAKQAEGMGKLPGSDLLIVNPDHVAVALAYDPAIMNAPEVVVKARNRHAIALKRRAFTLGIPIVENPPLARRLYQDCRIGAEIGEAHYRAVADLYLKLRHSPTPGAGNEHA